jgi:hypothetical protein
LNSPPNFTLWPLLVHPALMLAPHCGSRYARGSPPPEIDQLEAFIAGNAVLRPYGG